MTIDQILLILNGILISIVVYFLKQTMTDLKSTTKLAIATKSKLDVLENDHINKHQSLSKDMQKLTEAIEDNTKEMKEFRMFVFEKLSN